MNKPHEHLSWDSERRHAPERPSFVVSVTPPTLIERPKRVSIAYALVVLSVLGTLVLHALAAYGYESLRETLLAAMPDDLTEAYEADDLDRAVNLLLLSAAGLIIVLSLLQLVSVHSCHQHRRVSGRAWLVVLTVLSLPVMFLGVLLREGDTLDIAVSVAASTCLIAAVALLATPLVSQWLRQEDRPRSTPLTDLQHTQS